MKTKKHFITAALIAMLSGCIPSLNPLYTDKDLIFKSELIGTWTAIKSKETWTFEKKSDKKYKLIHSEKNNQATFEAHLVKIGDFLFLDIYPGDFKSDNYLYQAHLYPVHTFSKIKIESDKLTIVMFDPSWLEEGIEKKQIDVEHVKPSGGTILLTASTENLQKFVLQHANNENAFQDALILKKKD